MQTISSQLLKDYILVGTSYVVLLLALHPVYFGEYRFTASLAVVTITHLLMLFLVLGIGELVVTYLFRKPFSYSDDLYTRCCHFLLCTVVCVPVMMYLITQANTILLHGFEHANYAWREPDGTFSLKWILNSASFCIVAVVIMSLAMIILSEIHQMRYTVEELKTINTILEVEQEMLRNRLPKDNLTDKVILHGDSRDSLIVNPQDILYVESVANYLNIVYFNDADLCQKRLRSSLKDTEEALEAFPYLVHIHRAFLVNINFITQISGNTAGYKVQLFSTDKTLPVSKANITAFKEKITQRSNIQNLYK